MNMKGYTATLDNGAAIFYQDRKRWFWLMPFLGIWLHAATGNQAWLLFPLAINYIGGPTADWLLGEDTNNPPDAVVPELDKDRYYRYLTYLVVPLHFVALIGVAYWAGTQDLAWWAFIGLASVAGLTSGLAINTGHELGHKKSMFERNLAEWVKAFTGSQCGKFPARSGAPGTSKNSASSDAGKHYGTLTTRFFNPWP